LLTGFFYVLLFGMSFTKAEAGFTLAEVSFTLFRAQLTSFATD